MRQIAIVAGIHQFPPRSNMASGDFPWLEGNYKGTGYLEAVLIKGDTVTNDEYPDVVMTFSHGAFGEADKEVAEATGQKTAHSAWTWWSMGCCLRMGRSSRSRP